MAKVFSYIVRYDTGLAPNPFHGYCTLALCKWGIRKSARKGDWVVGTGSASKNLSGHLVYAMRVTEILSFDEYWNDPRFQVKKPDPKGGRERERGDNIYYWNSESGEFVQEGNNCYEHSCEDDLKADSVLISDDFIYWGGDGPPMPEFPGDSLVHTGRHYKCQFSPLAVEAFVQWMKGLEERGVHGNPADWRLSSKPNRRSLRSSARFERSTL